jgi:magnesium chelatase family protein
MVHAETLAVAIIDVRGHLVDVHAEVLTGPGGFTLSGLASQGQQECRDRVRAATANSGHPLPQRQIRVQVSPVDLPKRGTWCDLAIAVAVLGGCGIIPARRSEKFVHVAELGLDGRVRPVRGVFAAALAAVGAGHPDLVVAEENVAEAALVPGARVHGVRWLNDVIELHGGHTHPPEAGTRAADTDLGTRTPARPVPNAGRAQDGDLGEAITSPTGRHAVEVAAGGGHHLLLIGSTGTAAMASWLPRLLPDLSEDQAREVTTIHSVAGTLDPGTGLIRRPPFEHPHPTSTLISLVGGGRQLSYPGAACRAHRGVLFLEEACEFPAQVLEALLQPLDTGELVIHRAQGTDRFPARFQLVLATGCPHGPAHGPGLACTCAPSMIRRSQSGLSGPLLDRIDLQVRVNPEPAAGRMTGTPGDSMAKVAARVLRARTAQRERLAPTPWACNAEVPGSWLRGALQLPGTVTQAADHALETAHLSIRGYDQVLRIAWTLSDLAARSRPGRTDIEQALQLHGSELLR